MKKIWLYSVRSYINLGLFFYFRRVHIYNVNLIPKDKPVLLLANHQNALLDALLIATKSNRYAYFLTRAGVFKNPIITKILKSLQMLPVFRIRDGWSNLSNNKAIFNTCTQLFNKNEAIVIFPEGNHNIKRTVRPLSKGFIRIIFDTFKEYPDTDLQLIPVGLNYANAEKFPDSASLFFGEPITAKNFILENKNKTVLKLKKQIRIEISKLTTHIPSDNYSENINKLNNLSINFLKPQKVNKAISSNFKFYETLSKNKFSVLKSVFKILLILLLIIPYAIWKFIALRRIKEVEFVSTFRFAIAITLVPVWIFIMVIVLTYSFGWVMGLSYIIAVLCSVLVAVKA